MCKPMTLWWEAAVWFSAPQLDTQNSYDILRECHCRWWRKYCTDFLLLRIHFTLWPSPWGEYFVVVTQLYAVDPLRRIYAERLDIWLTNSVFSRCFYYSTNILMISQITSPVLLLAVLQQNTNVTERFFLLSIYITCGFIMFLTSRVHSGGSIQICTEPAHHPADEDEQDASNNPRQVPLEDFRKDLFNACKVT